MTWRLNLLRAVSYAALVGTSGILLLLWARIWIYGVGGFYEDNIAIRLAETILFAALVLLGLGLYIRHIFKEGGTR